MWEKVHSLVLGSIFGLATFGQNLKSVQNDSKHTEMPNIQTWKFLNCMICPEIMFHGGGRCWSTCPQTNVTVAKKSTPYRGQRLKSDLLCMVERKKLFFIRGVFAGPWTKGQPLLNHSRNILQGSLTGTSLAFRDWNLISPWESTENAFNQTKEENKQFKFIRNLFSFNFFYFHNFNKCYHIHHAHWIHCVKPVWRSH